MQWFSREFGRGAGRLVSGALSLAVLMLLTACPNKDKSTNAEPSQVVAQVNDSEISIHQVQALLQAQPGLADQLGAAAPGRVLDSLIDQELAAQAARKTGLDSSPRVLQSMELAKREVLARAYQDQLAEKVIMPDTEAIDRYYETHPALFAQRRQYTLQETMVKASAEQASALKTKVESLVSPEAINALMGESGLPHNSRNTIQWAEGLSMDLLPQLAYLKNGQSLGVVRPDGLVILTVLNSELSPLTRTQASNAIQAALMVNARKELVKQGMDVLRQKAKIQRMGPLAAAGAASVANVSASAASAP